MKKLGLALGAGGSRGVAHIGFLQALEEEGIRPDFVTGCSMGSIVGGCYCAGVTPQAMKDAVIDLKLFDLASLSLNRGGLMKMDKARKRIVSVMGEKNFDELEIPFACVATDIIKGRVAVLREGSVVDSVIASSSIPGVFTPASVGKYKMLVDGGILERVPTRELRRMGAEVIVAVDVLGNLMVKEVKGNLVDTLLRCIDIMDTRTTQRKHIMRKYVDLWLEPKLGSMDQYAVRDLDFAYEKGYELGKAKADIIRSLL